MNFQDLFIISLKKFRINFVKKEGMKMGSSLRLPSTIIYGFSGDDDYAISMISGDEVGFESAELFHDEEGFSIALYDFSTDSFEKYNFKKIKILTNEKKKYSYHYRIQLLGDLKELYAHISRIQAIIATEGEINTIPNLGTIQTLKFKRNALSDYAYENDEIFYATYAQQQKIWDDILSCDGLQYGEYLEPLEFAFYVSRYPFYKSICKKGIRNTIDTYLEQKKLKDTSLFTKKFQRLYIGNEFCPHNVMDDYTLLCILEISKEEGFSVTLALPYLLEDNINKTNEMMKMVDEWCRNNRVSIEVIINDFGMLELIKKYETLMPILGRLLNKRKKDPRIKWLWGIKHNKVMLEENNLNCEHYTSFLESKGICRYEFETHIFDNKIDGKKASLYFPYYQINTSVFCPLYARCTTGSKHQQRLVKHCPRYCEQYVFLYPKHLNMIGRGNSVFGYEGSILTQPSYLEKYVRQGIDRLVYEAF